MEQYKGKYIPFPPKKSWKWMKADSLCQAPNSIIHGKNDPFGMCKFWQLGGANFCRDCIYARVNRVQRKAYYEKCFPPQKKAAKSKEKKLPELTATAFHCPDCPKEAERLIVMPDGEVVAFDKDVQCLATLELKCKFPGQIKREKRLEDPLPHLVKPGALTWNSKYKYSKSTYSYYEGMKDGAAILLGNGAALRLISADVEDIGIEKYTAEELIGKAILTYTPTGVRYDVITGINEAGAIITGTNPDGMTYDTLIRCCRFLDGSMLFKVVH